MKSPERRADEALIDWDSVIADIQRYINSHAHAKQALGKLLEAGCDKKTILAGLYLYCGGKPEMTKGVKKDFGYRKKKTLALSRQLKEVAEAIEAVETYLTDYGIVCHFTPETSNLRAYAKVLQRVGKTVFRDLASKRISGRDHHIVILCRKVKLATGSPHYNELAELINAVRVGYDPNAREETDAESLRKRISRYGLLDLQTEMEFDELRRSPETRRKGS